MSPGTFDLFKTLSSEYPTIEHIDLPIKRPSNVVYEDFEQDGDYDDDTDSDYVPDSGEETDVSLSTVIQNKRKRSIVSERDSSEDEITHGVLIQSYVADVHDDPTGVHRTTQMRHTESPSLVTNSIYSIATVDEAIHLEAEAVHPEAVDPEAEAINLVAETVDPEAVDLEAEADHPEAVNPEAEAINLVSEPEVVHTEDVHPEAVHPVRGRSKCGRKRKHPDYCISEKKKQGSI